MAYNKKPTMMEVKNAISNLITEMAYIKEHTQKLDTVFFNYLKFSKQEKKFKTWLEKEFAVNEKEQENEDNEKWQQKQDKEAK